MTNTTKAKAESNLLSPQLSKTRMCVFHLFGTCNSGSHCYFAHSDEELKPLPDLSRTRLCQAFFQTGRCTAKNCTYAHRVDELVADSCHKTKFCRFWQVGMCSNGSECRFAHSADELRGPARVTEKPQQQDQQYNNSLAIPATFGAPQVQTAYPVTPQHLIANGQEVPICASDLLSTQKGTYSPCNLAPPGRWSISSQEVQEGKKYDSSQEGQEWNPPSEMKLTRGDSTSTQDSDGFKSYSTFSDGSESEVETPPCDFGPDSYESSALDFPSIYSAPCDFRPESYESSALDFPPNYVAPCDSDPDSYDSSALDSSPNHSEGQEPFNMTPCSNLERRRGSDYSQIKEMMSTMKSLTGAHQRLEEMVKVQQQEKVAPETLEALMTELNEIASDLQELQEVVVSRRHLPTLWSRVQQPSGRWADMAIENEMGDIIAPLAHETPATPLDDDKENVIWQAFLAIIDYQVKNTFISVKEPTNYPLRRVRSAAGRLTEIGNHS